MSSVLLNELIHSYIHELMIYLVCNKSQVCAVSWMCSSSYVMLLCSRVIDSAESNEQEEPHHMWPFDLGYLEPNVE
jgi:hypothetical protein